MKKFVLEICILLTALSANASYNFNGYSIGQGKVNSPILKSNTHELGFIAVENINRFNIMFDASTNTTIELGLEINQVFQKIDDPLQSRKFDNTSSAYRVDDLNKKFIKSDSGNKSWYGLKQLDRLSWSQSINAYDLIIGRQQISFGSAKLVNPTDLFSPFNLVEINKEERNGVDAIRLRKSLGANSEFDVGMVIGQSGRSEDNAVYFRMVLPISKAEVKPLFTNYKDAWGFGVDILYPILGANFYLEALSTHPQKGSSYLRGTTGYEYQWTDEFYSVMEYHFNGAGQTQPSLYDSSGTSFAISKGGSFLFARHYVNFLFSWQASPLHSIGLTNFYNLNDDSFLFSPSWDWSLSDESTLTTGIFLGVGNKSNFLLLPKSEFGLYGKSIFTKYKYFY